MTTSTSYAETPLASHSHDLDGTRVTVRTDECHAQVIFLRYSPLMKHTKPVKFVMTALGVLAFFTLHLQAELISATVFAT